MNYRLGETQLGQLLANHPGACVVADGLAADGRTPAQWLAEAGEQVAGEQVAGEYAGQGPTVDARGFFCTRDQGRFDDADYLFVEGRVDDTIIRGAENIAPAEIGDVLLRRTVVARLNEGAAAVTS